MLLIEEFALSDSFLLPLVLTSKAFDMMEPRFVFITETMLSALGAEFTASMKRFSLAATADKTVNARTALLSLQNPESDDETCLDDPEEEGETEK